MDYNEFKSKALLAWQTVPEEQSEMYKHHYLAMADEISKIAQDPVTQEEKDDPNPIVEQLESQSDVKMDTIISNNSFSTKSKFVKLLTESEMVSELAKKQYSSSDDKFIAMVHFNSSKNILIDVPAGENASINILFACPNKPFSGQIIIRVGEGATLNLLEFTTLQKESEKQTFMALLHEVTVEKNAKAEINIIRNEGKNSITLNFYKAKTNEYAHLKTNILYNGGGKIRSRNNIICAEEMALNEINESIASCDPQKFDMYTHLLNDAPKTICHSETKALIMGTSNGYVKGFAKILKGAVGSRSYVEERGLILDKGGYINLIPDMSIDENEVKATHSGASAPIDPNILFYLMSRGLDLKTSRQLVVNGFFGQILSKMEKTDAKRMSMALIHDKVAFGKFGHVPKIEMNELWVSDVVPGQSIFGGHYKYR
jgi:Fe-S cluster assembly scaffold protein SufB